MGRQKFGGRFVGLDGPDKGKTVNLKAGDILAFDTMDGHTEIVFIRPSGSRYGFTDSRDKYKKLDPSCIFYAIDTLNLLQMMDLISAVVGMPFERIDRYPPYNMAFHFVEK